MVFVKVVKSATYFKRFQVQKRRRREGKTDYYARRGLVRTDLNSYGTPKYRLVVRRTNKRIICQIVYATIQGDRIVCSADSSELTHYGIPLGHTNYAAAYCTGLLVARRLLKQLNLDQQFVGVEEATGETYNVHDEEHERRPFRAVLDVGLIHTTTGNRAFGAMKGAVDGGVDIPHSEKRFPGYTAGEDGKEGSYDAGKHRERIFGEHVSSYMKQLKDDEEAGYEKQFSRYIKAGIAPESVPELYKKAHAAIRANPDRVKKEKVVGKSRREGQKIITASGKSFVRNTKLTLAERKDRIKRKMAMAVKAAMEAQE